MPRPRVRALVAPVAVALVLALTGCTEERPEASDNGPQPDPVQPGGIVRTPQPVESAPLTVPLPGETNDPDVSTDTADPDESPTSR